MQTEIRNLGIGMHPGIGTSGTVNFDFPSELFFQKCLDFSLYRLIRGFLTLPAFISGAVILDRDPVIYHAAKVSSCMVCCPVFSKDAD